MRRGEAGQCVREEGRVGHIDTFAQFEMGNSLALEKLSSNMAVSQDKVFVLTRTEDDRGDTTQTNEGKGESTSSRGVHDGVEGHLVPLLAHKAHCPEDLWLREIAEDLTEDLAGEERQRRHGEKRRVAEAFRKTFSSPPRFVREGGRKWELGQPGGGHDGTSERIIFEVHVDRFGAQSWDSP